MSIVKAHVRIYIYLSSGLVLEQGNEPFSTFPHKPEDCNSVHCHSTYINYLLSDLLMENREINSLVLFPNKSQHCNYVSCLGTHICGRN